MQAGTVIVTGVAGFIGSHAARRLLADGWRVVGIDNLNDYYDVGLKEARLRWIGGGDRFQFERLDVCDANRLAELFRRERPERVLHLAAQAGVRHSVTHPQAYASSNLVGFLNVLEACRAVETGHLVYASSSSVYGASRRVPSSIDQVADHPLSLYAATKRANELMAHAYSHLYRLPTTGLRFFTVYGPWGRPDMAYYSFANAMVRGDPIALFNEGRMRRDFTYVDDIVEGVVRVLGMPAAADPEWIATAPRPGASDAPYRLFNIGNHAPVELRRFVEILENHLGLKARIELKPMQPGDVEATCADVSELQRVAGFEPATPIEEGLRRFVEWYLDYHAI